MFITPKGNPVPQQSSLISSTLQSSEITSCFLSVWICLFWTFHTNWIVSYVTDCLWCGPAFINRSFWETSQECILCCSITKFELIPKITSSQWSWNVVAVLDSAFLFKWNRRESLMALFSVFIFALKIRERRRACFLSNPATFLFEILLKHVLFSSFFISSFC